MIQFLLALLLAERCWVVLYNRANISIDRFKVKVADGLEPA